VIGSSGRTTRGGNCNYRRVFASGTHLAPAETVCDGVRIADAQVHRRSLLAQHEMARLGVANPMVDNMTWWDPRRCAVVVVDVQNDFCHPDGAMSRYGYDTAPVRQMVSRIADLLDAARTHSVPRIYLQVQHDEWSDDPAWLARSSTGGRIELAEFPLVQADSWGAQLYGLSPAEDELVLAKPRYSGFAYTALELALRAKRRDTVLLAGVATNVCVRATAVDAVTHGFVPVLMTDATAAMSATEHQAAVREFRAFYGPVAQIDEVRAAWAYPAQSDCEDSAAQKRDQLHTADTTIRTAAT
jgi:ureidoacrylate peracid hydrolase